MAHGQEHTEQQSGHEKKSMSMNTKFGIIMVVSLGLMWVLSISMVRTVDHFYFNLSNFYMALIMVAAIGVVMVVGMWSMLKNPQATLDCWAGSSPCSSSPSPWGAPRRSWATSPF